MGRDAEQREELTDEAVLGRRAVEAHVDKELYVGIAAKQRQQQRERWEPLRDPVTVPVVELHHCRELSKR
jgi:hypothetical protein